MKSVLAKKEDNRAHLEIEVPPADVEKALDRAYRRLARTVVIPGFRKGKAPRPLIERRLGKKALYDEALEELLSTAYSRAIQDTGIEPIDQPEISDIKLSEGEPLQFKVVVTVKPDVTLGDYRSIKVERPEVNVSDDDVEKVLADLRNQHAQLVPVDEEQKAQAGLVVNIDFSGTINGEPFEGGSAENYLVELGTSQLLKEFEDQIIGMAIGETRKFTITYPDDFINSKLAGKTAEFQVHLKGLKRKELPELDDDFARTVGSFANLEELRKDIKNRLSQRAVEEAENRLRQEVVDAVVEGATVDIPEVLVRRRIDQLVDDFSQRLQAAGGPKLEEYLQSEGQTIEQFREQFVERAQRDVKTALVLEAVARAENIEPDENDLGAEAVRLAEAYGQDVPTIKKLMDQPSIRGDIIDNIRIRKTIDYLVELATDKEKSTESQ